MLATSELRTDRPYRRALAAAILVLAGGSGFAIGRATAASPATAEESPIPSVGAMSEGDRTRFEVHRKMNRILGPEQRSRIGPTSGG
jgi:hypothetical protein